MKRTENGRVTAEHLDQLEGWATKHPKHPKPWSMGVSSHVVKAMIDEIREHREDQRTNTAAAPHLAQMPRGASQACYCTHTGGQNHPWAAYGAVDRQGRQLDGDGRVSAP